MRLANWKLGKPWGWIVAATAALALVACSQMMDTAKQQAGGLLGGSSKSSSSAAEEPPPQVRSTDAAAPTPAPAPAPAAPRAPANAGMGGAGMAGRGGMGGPGMNTCLTNSNTREDTSKCYRGYGDQQQQMATMCKQRADSGMYDSQKADYQNCATTSGNGANAFYCIADDILKPGTQMETVQKACFAKYNLGK
jgi:hypothetical protein